MLFGNHFDPKEFPGLAGGDPAFSGAGNRWP
jgi:hypothetical protein